MLHLWFLLTYIIFVHFAPLPFFSVLGYTLNEIVSMGIFCMLFGGVLMWIYKAHNWHKLSSKQLFQISDDAKILDINGDLKINERDKLTLILAHIPFIGAYLYGKYANYKVVKNIWKFNLYITTLILLLYISGGNNLADLIILSYIVYIVFVSINLFISQKLIQINLDAFPTPSDLRIYLLTTLKYIKNYFSKQKFINYSTLKQTILTEEEKTNKTLETQLKSSKKKTQKYALYIQSAIVFIVLTIIVLFTDISNKWLLILSLSGVYTLGYIKHSLIYKTPFIHDVYVVTSKIFTKIKSFFIKTKKLHEKEEVKTMKVK